MIAFLRTRDHDKNRKHVCPTTLEYVYVDVPDGFCEANRRRNAMRFLVFGFIVLGHFRSLLG